MTDPTGRTMLEMQATKPWIRGDDLIAAVFPHGCLKRWKANLETFAYDLKKDGVIDAHYIALAQIRELEYVMEEFGVS